MSKKKHELITDAELCERTGIARKTLYFWRLQGMPFVEITRLRIGYYEDDVVAWLKSHLKGPYGYRAGQCKMKGESHNGK